MKKIALITDGITPYVIGGMQRHSFYLAKYFAKMGVYVDLYHTNQSDLSINDLECFSAEEKEFIKPFVIPFPKSDRFPGHYIRASYKYSETVFEVFKKQAKVDFIYVKGFSGWKLLEEKKSGFKCAPVGVNFHGFEMFQKQPGIYSTLASKFLLQKPVLTNVSDSDYVFSYGAKITEIIKSLGVKDEKIIECPTGIEDFWINQEEIKVPGNRIKFVFMGRFERRKGVQELNEAIKHLLAEQRTFEFHFIGAIPEGKKIKSNKVVYHGTVRDSALIKNILSSMDVLVCPSYSEGMPNVIMEGMACGLCVIATGVGAVEIVVSDSTGFLLHDPAPLSIKKGMEFFLDNPFRIIERKMNARNFIKEKFLWSTIIRQLLRSISERIKDNSLT